MYVGDYRRFLYRTVICSVVGEGDVVLNRVGEEEVILRNISYSGADVLDFQSVYVVSVNEKRSVGNIVGSQQQVYESGFTRACRADDAYVFSRLYVQTYVVKRVKISSGIAECKMAVLDIPANVVYILCTVLVRYLGNFVEQCADSAEGCLTS